MRGTFEEEEVHNIFKPEIETKKRDKGSHSEEAQRFISNWKLFCGHKEEISLAVMATKIRDKICTK